MRESDKFIRNTMLWECNSRNGAPMGRSGIQGDPDTPYKFYVRRVPMVDGDYDCGGAYWGSAISREDTLYTYVSTCGEGGGYARGPGRDAIKRIVKEDYPHATFFR